MEGAEESQLWAVSASALFDLSKVILQSEVPRMIAAEILGINNKLIEQKKPEVYEAVQFICSQILERWKHALEQQGHDSNMLSEAIERIKSGNIKTTKEIVEIVGEYECPMLELVNPTSLVPIGGWVEALRAADFESQVARGEIHIGQYL